MKTLKDYISTDLKSLETSLTSLSEASLLDIKGTLGSGNEAIKKIIEKWIYANFRVDGLKISDNTNKDGLYEVSAVDVSTKNKNITSLTNDLFIWKEVKVDFDCFDCTLLKTLEGAPKEVGGNFNCSYCKSLKSLEGAPKKVSEDFSCSWCTSLTSLEGAPKKIGRDFSCSYCRSLTSLKDAPKEVGGFFSCSYCRSLTSLKGAPKEVGGWFYCDNCSSLKSIDLPATTKIKGKIYK